MPFYIPALVSKFECIGNTLSTFNISFSNLDTNLYNLSNYTVASVNFLSSAMVSVSSTLKSDINFLSSTMVSVSSTLRNDINFLSSSLVSVSANLQNKINFLSAAFTLSATVISDYVRQGSLICPPDGQSVSWNVLTNGRNTAINLTANIRMNNPTGLIAGESGNLIVNIQTAGKSITSFGSAWNFVNDLSSLNTALNTKNIISYYYDGSEMLSNLLSI